MMMEMMIYLVMAFFCVCERHLFHYTNVTFFAQNIHIPLQSKVMTTVCNMTRKVLRFKCCQNVHREGGGG